MVGYQIGIIGADGDQDTWFSANFQYIGPIVAKMRLPPGLCLGPHLGASSSPSWQTLGLTTAEGPTELRAPGPRDPTIRHWLNLTDWLYEYNCICPYIILTYYVRTWAVMKIFAFRLRWYKGIGLRLQNMQSIIVYSIHKSFRREKNGNQMILK